MNVVGRPADDFSRGLAGKGGGKDFVAPEAIGGQAVQVEGQGEGDEEEWNKRNPRAWVSIRHQNL